LYFFKLFLSKIYITFKSCSVIVAILQFLNMKKILLSSIFCLGLLFAFTDANAQAAPNTMGSSTKDEYWGTSKTAKGAGTDEVGARGAGLDKRYNDYEGKNARKSAFDKKRVKSKKMKEIEKKEKLMHKKHRRDKRMLARNRR
jgi:hypothetical protein